METVSKKVHYQRQFLASEEARYDEGSCASHVFLNTFDEDRDTIIQAELRISDGYNVACFNIIVHDDDHYDEYLAMITNLMEQVIAYRQAYAAALNLMRGGGQTNGGEATTVALAYPEVKPTE